MAAVTFDPKLIAETHPINAEKYDGIAAVAIEAGDIITFNTAGRLVLSGANTSNIRDAIGVALNKASIGKPVSYLVRGTVGGFTLTGNFGSPVYLSDTAGDLADGPGTTNIPVAKVWPIPEGNSPVKVLMFDFNIVAVKS